MSLPTPPSSLDGSCSVIHEGILYTYTPDSFLQLPLRQGGKWKKLEMGEKVKGAACVGVTSGEPGFFVVGGIGGSEDYTGLQKYTYSSKEWTTITPTDLVTKHRQWHGATYIKANDAILIYAGNQDGIKTASTQTFTVQAQEPYLVQSFDGSQHATPAIEPILLNWSDYDACLVGGDAGNQVVALFNPAAGWRPSGTTLTQGLPKERGSVQAVLVNGDDNSKSLYTFDLSVSPNEVTRFVVQDADGLPINNSPPVTKQKRDLSLDDWPEYNSTLAPDAVRRDYAIAQGASGMVVFSGGNQEEPIAIFNAVENEWVNATKFLTFQEQKLLSESSSTSSTFSTTTTFSSSTRSRSTQISTTEATATSTDSSTISETTAESTTDAAAAAGGSGDSGPSSNTILGITLGSILAFLMLLGIVLFFLRRRRARKNHAEAGHARRDSGPSPDEKDPTAFARGTHAPPPSPNFYRKHHHQASNESYSSMAILMGRVGQQKSSLTRKPSNDTSRSSVESLHKHFKSTISKPILQVSDPEPSQSRSQNLAVRGQDDKGVAFHPGTVEPRPRNGPLQADDGMRRSSGWNRYWSGGSALQILGFGGSRRSTVASDRSSRYSEVLTQPSRVTQDSATVPPLNFKGQHPEVNSVNSGSPVVATYGSNIPFKDGMAGKIERPPSNASSGYSSGIPDSINNGWDGTDSKPWGTDRAPSNAYTPSFYYATPLTPSSSGVRQPPSGVSKQPQLAMASTSSDMSWLNLGDQSRR